MQSGWPPNSCHQHRLQQGRRRKLIAPLIRGTLGPAEKMFLLIGVPAQDPELIHLGTTLGSVRGEEVNQVSQMEVEAGRAARLLEDLQQFAQVRGMLPPRVTRVLGFRATA